MFDLLELLLELLVNLGGVWSSDSKWVATNKRRFFWSAVLVTLAGASFLSWRFH